MHNRGRDSQRHHLSGRGACLGWGDNLDASNPVSGDLALATPMTSDDGRLVCRKLEPDDDVGGYALPSNRILRDNCRARVSRIARVRQLLHAADPTH